MSPISASCTRGSLFAGCGVLVGLLGVSYFANVHFLPYFIIVQIFVGIFEVSGVIKLLLSLFFQSTGWPATVAVMGNWFGKKNRGLLMGVWNAHTSVGNILGTAVPSIWAKPCRPWLAPFNINTLFLYQCRGWSFLVPAFVMIFVGLLMFFFLILGQFKKESLTFYIIFYFIDPRDVGLPPPQHQQVVGKLISNCVKFLMNMQTTKEPDELKSSGVNTNISSEV